MKIFDTPYMFKLNIVAMKLMNGFMATLRFYSRLSQRRMWSWSRPSRMREAKS